MIIFDLDGTLADCEHRRHFIDPEKAGLKWWDGEPGQSKGNWTKDGLGVKWKPDWKSFHEACVYDTPIEPVISQWDIQISLGMMGIHEIWSGRCESVREQTEMWLYNNLLCFAPSQLKMRPVGDNTPDDLLKESWLDERCTDYMRALIKTREAVRHDIDYVYDDRKKVVRMWRRRGIFVFDCNQSEGEF